jgi:hypothetical protein
MTAIEAIQLSVLEDSNGSEALRAMLPFAQESYLRKLMKRATIEGRVRAIDVIIQYSLDYAHIVYGCVDVGCVAEICRQVHLRSHWMNVYRWALAANRVDICKEMLPRIMGAERVKRTLADALKSIEFDEALITLRQGLRKSYRDLDATDTRYWKVDYSGHIEDHIAQILMNVSRGGNREIIGEVREKLSYIQSYLKPREMLVICAAGAARGDHEELSEEFLSDAEKLPVSGDQSYDVMKYAFHAYFRSRTLITRRIADVITGNDSWYAVGTFAARSAITREQICAALAIDTPLDIHRAFTLAAFHGNTKFCVIIAQLLREKIITCSADREMSIIADEMFERGLTLKDAATCELAIAWSAETIYTILDRDDVGLQTYIHTKIIDTHDKALIRKHCNALNSENAMIAVIQTQWIRECEVALA